MQDGEGAGAVTRLLNQWQQGDASSFDQLSQLIYGELHRIAERYLRQTPDGTLQPTALVNEAYLRLAGQQAEYADRKHFFALAAKVMRQVLVDRARAHAAEKRGGGVKAETLREELRGAGNRIEEFLILDQALTKLATQEPRVAEIIELHYFGGMTGAEIADVLGISTATVSRDQRLGEAWLRRALAGG